MMRPAATLMSSCLFPFMSLGVRRSGSTGIRVWVHWETRLVTVSSGARDLIFLGASHFARLLGFFIAMAGAEGGTGSNGQAGGGHGWWIAFTSASFFASHFSARAGRMPAPPGRRYLGVSISPALEFRSCHHSDILQSERTGQRESGTAQEKRNGRLFGCPRDGLEGGCNYTNG